MLKIVQLSLLLLIAPALTGQTEFPYSVSLEPHSITGLPGIHSYAHAQHDGKWLIIGGRLDGIHARQPFNAFPASQNNSDLWVVDPEAGEVWTASVSSLPVGLREQLQATNFQFFQDGDWLVLIGGYAYSESEGDHITFPYLTLIDVPALMANIINGTAIGNNFQQLTDDGFAVSGGYLGKIGEAFYLVGGHRFDGRYNPMNMPTFVQAYTDAIRKFTLENSAGTWSFGNYEVISDPVHLHRRDYNLLPQIYPDGSFGYTIFSGVFQLNEDLPFLYPVNISAAGHEPVTDFNQYLSNYHSAHIALHDAESNQMHNLFFGGISQYYFDGTDMVQDNDVPFVKTISRVSRSADGVLEEVRLPLDMPGFLGASAELFVAEGLPLAAPDLVELSDVTVDSILLGYIFGGIESASPHAFVFNNTGATAATPNIYKVFLKKNTATAAQQPVMPGYHGFKISVSPNPNDSTIFRVEVDAPEAGALEIFLADTKGSLLLNEKLEGLPSGKNTIEVEMDSPQKGLTFLTVVLNGKFSASTKLIFK